MMVKRECTFHLQTQFLFIFILNAWRVSSAAAVDSLNGDPAAATADLAFPRSDCHYLKFNYGLSANERPIRATFFFHILQAASNNHNWCSSQGRSVEPPVCVTKWR